jgi:hypothetical protein
MHIYLYIYAYIYIYIHIYTCMHIYTYIFTYAHKNIFECVWCAYMHVCSCIYMYDTTYVFMYTKRKFHKKYLIILSWLCRVLREMKSSLEVECEQMKRKVETSIEDNNRLVRDHAVRLFSFLILFFIICMFISFIYAILAGLYYSCTE